MKLDSQDRFEIKALAFYRETGILAPGKDASPMALPIEDEERTRIWREWLTVHGATIVQVLRAVEDYT